MSESRPFSHVPVATDQHGRPFDFAGYYEHWKRLQGVVEKLRKLATSSCATRTCTPTRPAPSGGCFACSASPTTRRWRTAARGRPPSSGFTGGWKRGEEEPGALFRRGVVGDWRNHIPLELANTCCAEVADVMETFGYEPVARPATAVA